VEAGRARVEGGSVGWSSAEVAGGRSSGGGGRRAELGWRPLKVARRRAAGGAARREGGGWQRIWGGDLEGGGRAEGRDAKSSGSCSDGAFPLVV